MAKVKFLTDEDFNGPTIYGVKLQLPGVDIVRVQEAGLRTLHDRQILEWAAQNERIVLSHDIKTMKSFALERLRLDLPMPGLFLIPQSVPIGRAIEEIVLVAECSEAEEWNREIRFLPM